MCAFKYCPYRGGACYDCENNQSDSDKKRKDQKSERQEYSESYGDYDYSEGYDY